MLLGSLYDWLPHLTSCSMSPWPKSSIKHHTPSASLGAEPCASIWNSSKRSCHAAADASLGAPLSLTSVWCSIFTSMSEPTPVNALQETLMQDFLLLKGAASSWMMHGMLVHKSSGVLFIRCGCRLLSSLPAFSFFIFELFNFIFK